MQCGRFHIYIIGILLINFYALNASAQTTEKSAEKVKMVEVEPSNVITSEVDGDYKLLPYRERRGKWGTTIGVSYSNFEPVNYEPNFLQVEFEDIYTSVEMPMIELQIAVKRNMSRFSIGGEISVGIYQNDSDEPKLIQSSLQLVPIKIGGVVLLDGLSSQPYFAPYVSGGGYMMLYKEDNNDVDFKGNTQVAPYIHAGIALSLDWIDRSAARISYEDSGIEASYAFVEARSLFEAGDEQDPDFSSPISVGAGIKVEF